MKTLFELNENELKQICEVVINRKYIFNSEVCILQKYDDGSMHIDYTVAYHNKDGELIEDIYLVYIDKHLNINVSSGGILISLQNIIKYADLIRKLLN